MPEVIPEPEVIPVPVVPEKDEFIAVLATKMFVEPRVATIEEEWFSLL